MSVINLENMSDDAVLAEIGSRLSRYRLNLNMTQDGLAAKAGVSRNTVSNIERGDSTSTRSITRVLRALDINTTFGQLVPAIPVSPIDMADNEGKTRRRATKRNPDRPDQGYKRGSLWLV